MRTGIDKLTSKLPIRLEIKELEEGRKYLNKIKAKIRDRSILVSPLLLTPCLYCENLNNEPTKYITDKYSVIYHYMSMDSKVVIGTGTKKQLVTAKDDGGVLTVENNILSLVLPSGIKLSVDVEVCIRYHNIITNNIDLVVVAYMYDMIMTNEVEFFNVLATNGTKLLTVNVGGETKMMFDNKTSLPKVIKPKSDRVTELSNKVKDLGTEVVDNYMALILDHEGVDQYLSKLMLLSLIVQRTLNNSRHAKDFMILNCNSTLSGMATTGDRLVDSIFKYTYHYGELIHVLSKTNV